MIPFVFDALKIRHSVFHFKFLLIVSRQYNYKSNTKNGILYFPPAKQQLNNFLRPDKDSGLSGGVET
jgi:hypothetical protein